MVTTEAGKKWLGHLKNQVARAWSLVRVRKSIVKDYSQDSGFGHNQKHDGVIYQVCRNGQGWIWDMLSLRSL